MSSASQQPQWSTAAGGTAGARQSQPTATSVSGVAVSSMGMEQLSHQPLDIKRWINNVVRYHVEELKRGEASSTAGAAAQNNGADGVAVTVASREEQAVNKLFNKMQAHAQHVGSSVEEHISQAIVRLPRATMELQRMIAEANELSIQLQATRDVVKPVVEARSHAHAQRLNALRETQSRLRRCQSILEKALAVDSNTAKIAQAIQPLQRDQGRRGSEAEGVANSIGPSSSSTSGVNVAELSVAIRTVKQDLRELQAVDPSFGEKHRVALEQHEQVIEQALEHECLTYLASHDATRAAELLRPLHHIGRAGVVMQGYAKAVTADCVAVMKDTLAGAGGKHAPGAATGLSAAQAAKALKETVMPVVRATLESELNFLMLLYECMGGDKEGGADPARDKTSAKASRHGDEDGSGATAADGPSPATEGSANGGQLQTAMTAITDQLGSTFQSAMAPILDSATHNSDIIACYDATRSVKVSAAAPAESPLPPASTSDVGSASPTTTRLGARERATVQASSQVLSTFLAVFQREGVMQGFCQRTAARIATAAGGLTAGSGSVRSTTDNAPLLLFLQNAHVQQELISALLDGVRDALHFFPDQTIHTCVPQWSHTLSTLFHALFPASAPTSVRLAGSAAEAPSPPPQTTAMALVKLSLVAKCARPAVEAMKKEVDAFLSSAEVQGSYPSIASAAQHTMHSTVWSPLLTSLDAAILEAQQTAKGNLLGAIMASVAGYGELPVWGRGAGHKSGSNAAAPPLASYALGHVTPSEAVREFGESLMGTPLVLESLSEEVGSVEGLLANFFFSSSSAAPGSTREAGLRVSSSLSSTVKAGVEELLDERAAAWLDDIVRAAVDSFVEENICSVRVDFAPPPSTRAPATAADPDALKKISQAWEQIAADLEYLRNVLSAVSEEQYAPLENCLEVISALPPPSDTKPFTVGDELKEGMRAKE